MKRSRSNSSSTAGQHHTHTHTHVLSKSNYHKSFLHYASAILSFYGTGSMWREHVCLQCVFIYSCSLLHVQMHKVQVTADVELGRAHDKSLQKFSKFFNFILLPTQNQWSGSSNLSGSVKEVTWPTSLCWNALYLQHRAAFIMKSLTYFHTRTKQINWLKVKMHMSYKSSHNRHRHPSFMWNLWMTQKLYFRWS